MINILFWIAIFPLLLLSLLPLRLHYLFSRIVVAKLLSLLQYRKSVVVTNLARSFPSMKYNEIEKITKEFYRNLSYIVAENIKGITLSKKGMKKLVKIENPQLLASYYKVGASPLIIGGHLSNWELMTKIEHFENGDQIGYRGEEFNIIYKKQSSKFADRAIKWVRLRGSTVKLLESNSLARAILKSGEGRAECYLLFSDQAPLPGSKFSQKFLNQETFMINGPEQLSRAANLPVLYLEMERVERGRYLVRFKEIAESASSTEVGEITAKYCSLLEESINRAPSNWLWSHKRWKRGAKENRVKNIK